MPVTFQAYRHPALQAGWYRLTAHQRISRGEELLAEFADRIRVHATVPRFTLTPERIHSRHPAPGATGNFSAVLPHIALTSPTLPWLREPARSETPGDRTGEPWLALLVFDSSDPAPEVVTGPLSSLLGCERYPGSPHAETGERPGDLCQWIDIDAELLAKVAPEVDELRWLTHVRSDDQEALAVVVANRLPPTDGVTTCCLVSLEGAAHVLPPEGEGDVRLPVLEAWTFSSATDTEDFGGLMSRLCPQTLRIPGARAELEHGYALLEHTLRQGALSASWYRGPLIPTDASRTRAVPAGNDSADELLRYDRHTGMFDVSLAAAWQLGRLLALADPELSVQIANWKASGHRAQNQASDRKLLADRVGIEADQPAADLQAQIAEALVKPVVERLVRR